MKVQLKFKTAQRIGLLNKNTRFSSRIQEYQTNKTAHKKTYPQIQWMLTKQWNIGIKRIENQQISWGQFEKLKEARVLSRRLQAARMILVIQRYINRIATFQTRLSVRLIRDHCLINHRVEHISEIVAFDRVFQELSW